MLKAEGAAETTDVYEKVTFKTFTCAHCGLPRVQSEKTEYWCDSCDARVCADKTCANECKPLMRKLEEAEARYSFRKSLEN